MLNPITKLYTDYSTADGFSFGFHCDRCGKEWRSETYAFNTETFAQPMDARVRELIWNRQHDEAFERANREAAFEFNRCKSCSRRVCNDCYSATETECGDVCMDCVGKDSETEPWRRIESI